MPIIIHSDDDPDTLKVPLQQKMLPLALSCDTFCATGSALAPELRDGTLFAKNSDRDRNEAQQLERIVARVSDGKTPVRATYISVPETLPAGTPTLACVISRPFWMWGCEMGVNEAGVAIGNEAVLLKNLAPPAVYPQSLLGMDIARLVLERCSTAGTAVAEIARLVEVHGISGRADYQHEFLYHNGFVVADAECVFVLHTAGREWVAKCYTGGRYKNRAGKPIITPDFGIVRDSIDSERTFDNGIATMSNAPSIDAAFDRHSRGFRALALSLGWATSNDFDSGNFDFRKCGDFLLSHFGEGQSRSSCTYGSLCGSHGRLTVQHMIKTLRLHHHDHSRSSDLPFDPAKAIYGQSVCMHAAMPPIRISQTTSSFVVLLREGRPPQIWATGTAAPCTSLFKPLWVDAFPPDHIIGPTCGRFDDGGHSLWWEHELLHRMTISDYSQRLNMYRKDRDQLEAAFFDRVALSDGNDAAARQIISEDCMREARSATLSWIKRVQSRKLSRHPPLFHSVFWHWHNLDARLRHADVNPFRVQLLWSSGIVVVFFLFIVLLMR